MSLVRDLKSLVGLARQNPSEPPTHPRIWLRPEPEVIYAIGDVHGCLSLLVQLQAQIDVDAAKYGSAATILLGDLIDRGPDFAQVLDYLLASKRPPNHPRYAILGNHEALFESFASHPTRRDHWLSLGGVETLASYGIPAGSTDGKSPTQLAHLVGSHIPSEHLEFIRALPILIETSTQVFVHAGIRPGTPLSRQTDEDLLWQRNGFDELYQSAEKVVVHGHIPVKEAVVSPRRIAIDTGAYLTGRLSAVRLDPKAEPFIITAR